MQTFSSLPFPNWTTSRRNNWYRTNFDRFVCVCVCVRKRLINCNFFLIKDSISDRTTHTHTKCKRNLLVWYLTEKICLFRLLFCQFNLIISESGGVWVDCCLPVCCCLLFHSCVCGLKIFFRPFNFLCAHTLPLRPVCSFSLFLFAICRFVCVCAQSTIHVSTILTLTLSPLPATISTVYILQYTQSNE